MLGWAIRPTDRLATATCETLRSKAGSPPLQGISWCWQIRQVGRPTVASRLVLIPLMMHSAEVVVSPLPLTSRVGDFSSWGDPMP